MGPKQRIVLERLAGRDDATVFDLADISVAGSPGSPAIDHEYVGIALRALGDDGYAERTGNTRHANPNGRPGPACQAWRITPAGQQALADPGNHGRADTRMFSAASVSAALQTLRELGEPISPRQAQVAQLRIEYPDDSLASLATRAEDPPCTERMVYHNLRRLLFLAARCQLADPHIRMITA